VIDRLFDVSYNFSLRPSNNTSSASAGQLSASEERVLVSLEELQDLKGVWTELGKIWDQIFELKEKPWLSIQPRKVRTGGVNDYM